MGWTAALTPLLLCAAMPAATGDLSRYREFRLGMDVADAARLVNADASQAKVIHSRPAVLQELQWHPRTLGTAHQDESASDVVFRFYNGQLYRIAITYDRYQIQGMTADDLVEAVSTMYGPAEKVSTPAKVKADRYEDQDEVVARWHDSEYSFELIRSSWGPSFRLVGTVQALDVQARAAEADAKRMDAQEAPQREAARVAAEQAAEKAKLEKARLANKARFRP
jgi:hypothetical protein